MDGLRGTGSRGSTRWNVAIGMLAAGIACSAGAVARAQSGPSIQIVGVPEDRIGKDLQDEFVAALVPPVSVGTQVLIKASPTEVCRVSSADDLPGTALSADDPPKSLLIRFVAANHGRARFWIHALDTGTCTVEVSATDYPTATKLVTVDTPNVRLTGVPAKISRLARDDGFTARIGLLRSNGRWLPQEVRPAYADHPLPATNGIPLKVCVTDPSVATITGGILDGNCNKATVQTKRSFTSFKLDPHSPPSTDVCLATDGAPLILPPACDTVEVVDETVSVRQAEVAIGIGLQSPRTVRLSRPAASSGSITLHSTNTDVCVVSADPDAVGGAQATLPIDKSRSAVEFTVQVKATASDDACPLEPETSLSGYTPVPASIPLGDPGLRIKNLDASQTTQAPDNSFNVISGVLSSNTLRVAHDQALSKTETTRPLNVCSSDTDSAEILGDTPNCPDLSYSTPSGYKSVDLQPGTSRTADGDLVLDIKSSPGTQVCATGPGFTHSADDCVDVAIKTLIPMLKGADEIGEELQVPYTLALNGAVADDTAFLVESGDTGACTVAEHETDVGSGSITVTVPKNHSSAPFYVQGVDVDDPPRDCQITATPQGASGIDVGSKTVRIVQPGLHIASLPQSIKVGSPDKDFQVQIGVPDENAPMTGFTHRLRDRQDLRHDDQQPLEVTVCTSDAADPNSIHFAEVSNGVDSGMCVIAPIAEGDDATANDSLFLHPVSNGDAVVTAAAPNFIPAEEEPVTVAAAVIDLHSHYNPDAVGAALQDTFTVKIDPKAAPAGGVPVTIEVMPDSQSNCAITDDDESATQGTILQLTIAKGKTTENFVIRGLIDPLSLGEDEQLPCHLKASSTDPSYSTPDEIEIPIVKPAVRVFELGSTTTVASGNDPFRVDLGVPNAAQDKLQPRQSPWNTLGQAVEACSSDPNIAIIQPQPSPTPPYADCVSLTAPRGSTNATGFALDPQSPGPVNVYAKADGFISIAGVDVDVATAVLEFLPRNQNLIGAGLMDTFVVGSSAVLPVDTPITITSETPDYCLVAADENSLPGDDMTVPPHSTTVTIQANHSQKSFEIHGVAEGLCRLRAEAPASANLDLRHAGVRRRQCRGANHLAALHQELDQQPG